MSYKEEYQRRKENGLCVRFGCKEKNSQGNLLCDLHTKEKREYLSRYNIKLKKNGLCRRCRKPAYPGKVYCAYHLEMNNKFAQNSPNYGKNSKENNKRLRKRRVENRECLECGVPLDPDADFGKMYCMNCRDYKIRRIKHENYKQNRSKQLQSISLR